VVDLQELGAPEEIAQEGGDSITKSTIYNNEGQQPSACVLVVDDELPLLDLMSMFLELYGVRVKGFTNGQHAVAWYEKNFREVGAIYLDMQMPLMSGSECFTKLISINPIAMVVLMSGGVTQNIITNLLSKGAARFVPKPLDYPALVCWTLKRLGCPISSNAAVSKNAAVSNGALSNRAAPLEKIESELMQ